jgi:PAS domain S-box-containing protein
MKRQRMDQIWLVAPSPAIRLRREAAADGWQVNTAAQRWAAGRGLGDGLWAQVAGELGSALQRHAPATGRLAAALLDWQAVALADGWLVWLSPVAAAPSGAAADKLALVQDFLAVGVFERDLRTLRVRWDDQVFRLFGFDPHDGPPPFDVALARIHADDRAAFLSEHERFLREGGRHAVRYRVVLPDGSQRDLQSLVEVTKDAQGMPATMIGVIVDDTAGAGRVRAQQALSTYLAGALRLAQVSVWRVDFASQRIQFNDVGYEIMGLAPRPGGIDLGELRATAHPDDLESLLQAADRAIASDEVVDVEVRYRNAAGVYRPLLTRRVAERDTLGVATGLIGIAIDQTSQRAERERTQALLRRIELVADAAELGIWSLDHETGRIEWNATMFGIYGIGPDQLPATLSDWRDTLVHPDDRAALTLGRSRSIQSGAKSFETEFRILRSDGTVRWIVSRSRREVHDGRKFVIGIHLDTTELIVQRQLAEQALHEKEVALQASRAKSDFLARASHELRTPLNAVLGFAQLVEHDGLQAPPSLQLERVSHIRTAGEHLLALVDDVLDLAAIEAGSLPVSMGAVPVDDVLNDVVQWLESLAQRAGVTLHLQPSGAWVQADARRLRQIVANLMSNAVKFNRAGGRVWVGAQARGGDPSAAWDITVRDDGRGLALAQQAHLFEAFHRLGAERGSIEGVGLGLAIVRQLTELMDGHIDVVSAPGQGSEFRVTLKAAAAPPPRVAPAVAPAAADPAATTAAHAPGDGPGDAPGDAPSLTVLYIEDNPVNVILVEGLIALRPRVRLRCAVDGLSGVAMALADRPDVVLIDMQLPDIDGFEVRRRLRAEASLDASLMVALSANGLSDDIARALAAGFDDYWTKPIDFKLFLQRLDALTQRPRPAP